jgi:hypothetical protein
MTQEAPVTTEVPRFDVVARLPSNARLEDVQAKAVAAGIRPDRVEALVKALRSLPSVKIGAAVDRERADKAREQFTAAGLTVEITPVLALAPMMTGAFDNRFECPNCGQRVDLPENRQCPHCGVFVDKVTPEMIMRRKLREKEKLALDFRLQRDQQAAERAAREAMENQVREEVRRELEAELGLGEGRMTVNRNLMIGGALLVAASAFGAGLVSSGGVAIDGLFGSAKADQPVQDARTKGMLDQLDKLDKSAAKGGDTAAAARANGGPATGDPDVDDPLVQAAGGKRVGAKGISVEQAVQAAQTLAKAAGYKGAGTEAAVTAPGDPTASLEARIEGSGGAAPAASGGAPAGASGGAAGASPAGTDAAAAGTAATAAVAVQVSPRVRALVAVDLARTVAQVGQTARAREMIKALQDNPAYRADPALVEATSQAAVEIRAWGLHTASAGSLRQSAEAVLADARILPTPLARVQALTAAGAIAARHPLLRAGAAASYRQTPAATETFRLSTRRASGCAPARRRSGASAAACPAFGAQHQRQRAGAGRPGRAVCPASSLVPTTADAALLQLVQRARQVGHHQVGHGLGRAAGHLGHGGVDAHGVVLGCDDRMRTGAVGHAQAGAQVVRVGHAVEHQQQRRLRATASSSVVERAHGRQRLRPAPPRPGGAWLPARREGRRMRRPARRNTCPDKPARRVKVRSAWLECKRLNLPQTVPAYAATETINELRKNHPEYAYKEATLNPTNPRDRASDWEADIVTGFRNSEGTKELTGPVRETPTGQHMYIARPIKITNPACLACHNTAADRAADDGEGVWRGERLRLEDE